MLQHGRLKRYRLPAHAHWSIHNAGSTLSGIASGAKPLYSANYGRLMYPKFAHRVLAQTLQHLSAWGTFALYADTCTHCIATGMH
jgi:hypothetical protein